MGSCASTSTATVEKDIQQVAAVVDTALHVAGAIAGQVPGGQKAQAGIATAEAITNTIENNLPPLK